MTRSEIEALGYIGLEVSDISSWRKFASEILGLEAVQRPDGALDLRLDDHAMRIRLFEGPRDDLAFAGWEVKDRAALAALERRLGNAGIAVARLDSAEAQDRQVAELLRFVDPEGTVLEAFYGPLQRTDRPMVSPRGVAFKTGRQGLGHIVLGSADMAALTTFYTDLLGFRVSDHINQTIAPSRVLALTFMRCNTRHHSFAVASVAGRKKLLHIMVEVERLDDVGRAMDRCREAGIHLTMTLGRHSNDAMLSFYPLTPSGFDIEYGWGGLEVNEESWHVLTHERISAWGHHYQRPPKGNA